MSYFSIIPLQFFWDSVTYKKKYATRRPKHLSSSLLAITTKEAVKASGLALIVVLPNWAVGEGGERAVILTVMEASKGGRTC
jgi:hypothetical protein